MGRSRALTACQQCDCSSAVCMCSFKLSGFCACSGIKTVRCALQGHRGVQVTFIIPHIPRNLLMQMRALQQRAAHAEGKHRSESAR